MREASRFSRAGATDYYGAREWLASSPDRGSARYVVKSAKRGLPMASQPTLRLACIDNVSVLEEELHFHAGQIDNVMVA